MLKASIQYWFGALQTVALAMAIGCGGSARADATAAPQTASPATPDDRQRPELLPDRYRPAAPADDALYRALGGHAGLITLATEFHQRLLAHRELAAFFLDVDAVQFRDRLVVQWCEWSGGPCKQAQHNMRRLHSGFDINQASFNATVEVLQQAMDANGIAFRTQNQLLALLAPMHRDIVNLR